MSDAVETSTAADTTATETAATGGEDTSMGAADAVGTGDDGGAPDVAGGAVAQARAADDAAARKWRIKYGDDEREVDEAELLTLAQKAHGADRRFEEAASARKEAQTMKQQIAAAAQRMMDDPAEIMSALAGDEGRAAQIAAERMVKRPAFRDALIAQLLDDPGARDLAEQRMLERLRYERLPEDERRKIDEERALRARAKRADELEAAEAKRAEEARRQRETETARAEEAKFLRTYQEEARSSLTAAGLDPADPDVLERWAMERSAAIEHGVEMTAEEAARRVAAKLGATRKASVESLAQLEGDALLAALPPAIVAKIRAADAAKIKGGQRAQARAVQTGGAPKPRASTPKREYSSEAYVRAMRVLGVSETKRRMAAGEPLD